MSEPRDKTKVVAIELDEAELSARMAAAISGIEWPTEESALDFVNALDRESRNCLLRAAREAVRYFHEQVAKVANARLVHREESADGRTTH